jgi:hypothetical protein
LGRLLILPRIFGTFLDIGGTFREGVLVDRDRRTSGKTLVALLPLLLLHRGSGGLDNARAFLVGLCRTKRRRRLGRLHQGRRRRMCKTLSDPAGHGLGVAVPGGVTSWRWASRWLLRLGWGSRGCSGPTLFQELQLERVGVLQPGGEPWWQLAIEGFGIWEAWWWALGPSSSPTARHELLLLLLKLLGGGWGNQRLHPHVVVELLLLLLG